MKGKILDFNSEDRKGLITGEDGKRYEYIMAEWKGANTPKAGMTVDFDVAGDSAAAIYPNVSADNNENKRLVSALLAFFLGAFGVHKFYLGYTKQGLIMLFGFLFGFILLGLPSMVIAVIAFIEFIKYIIKSDEDFEQTYVVGQKPWF